ncbi:hypothetical protein WCD74_11360 [Actinomycetospora sp. OC33-EN08]|uniref:Mce-associated membrane protein n=1 Tax=Actinomycetospora aurantiaca TaxID=3129233 RepID=A0ABU8MM32_9PSEU
MPPRTRATTTTAPAGRRPKVAGLRDPRRRGVTSESPVADRATDDVVDHEAVEPGPAPEAVEGDATSAPDDEPTATTATTASAATDQPATTDGPASAAGTPVVANTSGDPDDSVDPDDAGDAPSRPTPKGRRTGRTMTPAAPSAAAAPTGRRGGTAVLDRPAPARPSRPGTEAGPSRLARALASTTRPVAALGATPKRLVTTLVVVLVLSLGLGTWALVAALADRAEGTPYANQAVVDVGGTAEVVGQSRTAIEQILSYDFTKLDDSVNAVRTQATGEFGSQYLAVFEQTIRRPATDQKLRQTASVLNIGVQQLSGDRATLLALVQFTAERTTNGQTTNAPGLLTVQVVKEDGRWKLSELTPV